jgi:hypothetical protein
MSELKSSHQLETAPIKGKADAVLEAQLRVLVSASADHDPVVVVPALVEEFGGFENSTPCDFSIASFIFYVQVTLNASLVTRLSNGQSGGFGRDSPWSKFWSCLTASVSDKIVRTRSIS